jgi:alanyl-tRNA synthetase
MDSIIIRQRFENYYKKLGFQQLPSASMLHPSIPMAFVMSAGLVQIEASLARFENRQVNRFVLVQDCFRQFDLDKVGTDDYHLSFFQMPGAFIFGPQNKSETVRQMWTLATCVLGVNSERIWASYFKGAPILGEELPPDEETRHAWLNLGISPDQVVGLERDNYWVQGGGIDGVEMVRKCGPNTELFYDRGKNLACGVGCKPGCACGRFVEFSNSLFIHREANLGKQTFHPMTEPFTETVIGAERVTMIVQGVSSVFETDSYRPLIECIKRFEQITPSNSEMVISSERVLADHLRALYGLVANGAPPPGKDGRQRIIKLLIRGAITRAILLGISIEPALPVLIRQVADLSDMDESKHGAITEQLRRYWVAEQNRFTKTVERGERQLTKYLAAARDQSLSGDQIVTLEKNWGIPHLLIARLLHARRLELPTQQYRQALGDWKRLPHY